jgi:hypothetical protein
MLAAGAAAIPLAFSAPANAEDTVNFTLDEQNGSGAAATATLTAHHDGSLHVSIEGSGFTPSMPHAQHIHGSAHGGMNFFCPTPDADKNGDGQVATEEGVAQYGGVVVSLTTKGDVSAKSGLALERFPVADAEGNLDYDRTIPAAQVPDGLVHNLHHSHIVQHGLDVNGNDKYDLDGLGESVFAKSLGANGVPEEGTNPATCGEVTPTGAVDTGADGTGGLEQMPLFAFAGTALVGAAGTFWLRRRFAPVAS